MHGLGRVSYSATVSIVFQVPSSPRDPQSPRRHQTRLDRPPVFWLGATPSATSRPKSKDPIGNYECVPEYARERRFPESHWVGRSSAATSCVDLSATAGQGRIAADPLSRFAPHGRHTSPEPEDTPQGRAGASRPLDDRRYVRRLQQHSAFDAGRSGRAARGSLRSHKGRTICRSRATRLCSNSCASIHTPTILISSIWTSVVAQTCAAGIAGARRIVVGSPWLDNVHSR
jgi:hypothetical protein